MRTYYEYPSGVAFYNYSHEAMAARLFGGKADDYLCPEVPSISGGSFVEVVRYTPEDEYEWTFVADVPILTDEQIAAHKRQGSL